MRGLGIRLYTDEDVAASVARELSLQGYDVLSCRDAGNHNQGLSDDWQPQYAASDGRANLTHNVVHFVRLDRRWKDQDRVHSGIIVVPNGSAIGDLIRRTALHLDTVSPEEQHNLLRHLIR